MSNIVKKSRTGKEKVYGLLMIVFGILLWPVVVLGVLAGMANPQAAPAAGLIAVRRPRAGRA